MFFHKFTRGRLRTDAYPNRCPNSWAACHCLVKQARRSRYNLKTGVNVLHYRLWWVVHQATRRNTGNETLPVRTRIRKISPRLPSNRTLLSNSQGASRSIQPLLCCNMHGPGRTYPSVVRMYSRWARDLDLVLTRLPPPELGGNGTVVSLTIV